MSEIAVSFLPEMLYPADLHGRVCVVVDLLRASTTIVRALESGATCVVPCLTPQDAMQLRDSRTHEPALLGGERGGLLIPGFDLANSPSHYTPDRLLGKTLIFTTTNGTKAIHAGAGAAKLLIGCFANVSALESAVARTQLPVHVLCAGTGGRITLEDCVFAGRLVSDFQFMGYLPRNDESHMARELYDNASRTPDGVLRLMRQSVGGMNLDALGLGDDVEDCRREDCAEAVPMFDAASAVLTRFTINR